MSQTLNSDFRTGINKKTDKSYKGRYSQMGKINQIK